MLDSDKNINTRINCEASTVSVHGFMIRIVTWADTKIYGAVCAWLAHGD